MSTWNSGSSVAGSSGAATTSVSRSRASAGSSRIGVFRGLAVVAHERLDAERHVEHEAVVGVVDRDVEQLAQLVDAIANGLRVDPQPRAHRLIPSWQCEPSGER